MERLAGWACTICGEKMPADRPSFAVAQSGIEDKVRIFHRESMVGPKGVHGACCSAHVRELVIHWMVTGSLDYPFAGTGFEQTARAEFLTQSLGSENDPCSFVTPIGELAIDRDSVNRVLSENPAWLEVILDELHDALERSIEVGPGMALADLPAILVHHT